MYDEHFKSKILSHGRSIKVYKNKHEQRKDNRHMRDLMNKEN